MRNRIIPILATITFIIFLPLMLIEPILSHSGNPVLGIKRNFHAVMFAVSLGYPKSSIFVS